MRRTRPLLAALLATSMLVALPGAGQAAETDYRITVVTGPAGPALSDPLRLTVRGATWAKYTGTITAKTASSTGRLLVSGGGVGTLALDMVSLFPRDTYKNRPNGMRRDLAEKIAALHP